MNAAVKNTQGGYLAAVLRKGGRTQGQKTNEEDNESSAVFPFRLHTLGLEVRRSQDNMVIFLSSGGLITARRSAEKIIFQEYSIIKFAVPIIREQDFDPSPGLIRRRMAGALDQILT